MNFSSTLDNYSTVALFDRIYRHIHSQPIDENVSLLSGQMGYALLEAYAQPYYDQHDDSHIWARIEKSLTVIQQGDMSYSFAGGMAGVAWGFLHLTNNGLLRSDDLDAQDIVSDLDEVLFELSMEALQKGDYDYLHDGLGAGLYFLERQPSPMIIRYVERMVATLAATAVRYANGDITWLFDDFGRRQPHEGQVYNPGLSHGTASIVSLLSLFYERGYARQQCAELIQGNLQWKWRNRNQAGTSVFPTLVTEPRSDQDSRLGWCYGDLGIANALWLCGQKLQNTYWQSIAYETMLKAAKRRLPEEASIRDAGLCHGTTGVAYLFRKFDQYAAHPLLAETADYWMQQTDHYVRPETDERTFHYFNGKQYSPNLGLLDGESSIGLALLAELGAPTGWDRFLLLS